MPLCYPLRQEAVRVELLSVGELNRVPKDAVQVNNNRASSWKFVLSWNMTDSDYKVNFSEVEK